MNGTTVLVVDDDPRARDGIAAVLQGAGARVRTARSAREALAALAEAPAQVLVTDIAMPGEDGYSLLADIRSRGFRLRATALTGLAAEADRRRGFAAGFDAYLTKPVSAAHLVRTVSGLVDAPRD